MPRSTDPTGSLQSNRVSVPVNRSHLKLEDTLEESLSNFNIFTCACQTLMYLHATQQPHKVTV